MARFKLILGTQTILDIAKQNTDAWKWFHSLGESKLYSASDFAISSASILQLRTVFQEAHSEERAAHSREQAAGIGGPDNTQAHRSAQLSLWHSRVETFIEEFKTRNSVLGVAPHTFEVYQQHLSGNIPYEGGEGDGLLPWTEKLVIATAISSPDYSNLTLVARRHRALADLSAAGLKVIDPADPPE